MQHRLSLLFTLILPLGLTSCFGPPLVEEVYPYGPPKYGNQGTQSPPPQQQQQQRQQQPPPGQPQPGQQGYNWQSHPGAGTTTYGPNTAQGGAPNQPVGPNSPAAGGTPQGTVPMPSNSGAATNSPGSSPAGGSAPAPKTPTVTSNAEIPYGIPVPGKDGMLFSPYSPDAGFIDITTPNADGSKSVLPPGTKIKDPFSNKPILVP